MSHTSALSKAVVDRRLPDWPTAASVSVIVAGCLVAGVGDLDFSGAGYALALLCAQVEDNNKLRMP